MKNMSEASVKRKAVAVTWIGILILGTLLSFWGIGDESLWYDESFSAAVAIHPVAEIVPIIAKDSHPPLYYLMLRAVVFLFGNSHAALRSLSALGTLAFASLGFLYLRKFWGEAGGIAFALVAILTPMSIVSAQEARMYSWLAFFVTATVLQGFATATDGKVRNWVILSVLTLAAAYTHYYGLMAVGFYWLFLLVRVIMGKDGKQLKLALGSACAIAFLYLPWLVFLFAQFSRVASHYWIGPLTLQGIVTIVSYPFMQKFLSVGSTLATILFAVTVVFSLTGIAVAWKKRDDNLFLSVSAFGVYVLTLAAGIFLSIVVRPILVERYMLSCMGLLLVAFVSFWSRLKRPVLLFAMVAVFAVTNAPTLHRIYALRVNGPMAAVQSLMKDQVRDTDIFVHGSEHNLGTFAYYFPRNRHFFYVPEGEVPNGNYNAFAPAGGYGADYAQFNDKPVTIWVTNTVGSVNSVHASDIADAAHRKAVGKQLRFRRDPGWYTVTMQKVAYDPIKEKPSTKTDSGSGERRTLSVTLNGIDASRGGTILYSVYTCDPISPDNFIASGSVPADSDSVTLSVDGIPTGYCAFFAFHDQNENNRPDFESGEGMSLGIDVGKLEGPPLFDDIKFEFNAEKPKIESVMNYAR